MSSEDNPEAVKPVRHCSPADVRQALAEGWQPLLVDVREDWERDIARLPESTIETLSIPMAAVPAAIPSLPVDRPLLFLCHHGVRSWHAACMTYEYRMQQKIQGMDIVNLAGGIDAWAGEPDPDRDEVLPHY